MSLRRRISPRQYNEDSEEDSVAAISKRLPGAQQRLQQRLRQRLQRRRRLAAAADHDYWGTAPPRDTGE